MSSFEATQRQKLILALVIRAHIENANPVGSKWLVDNFGLDISSATVRNEMAVLTEHGYLHQPHTSAGRVPTDDGYRYFVTRLMDHDDLPTTLRRTITHQFYQARHDIDSWMRLAATVLAKESKAASLITAPQTSQARFKHLELLSTSGRQVLMILVLMGGVVKQQMLVLAEPVSQDKLSITAEQLTLLCQGKNPVELLSIGAHLDDLGQDILTLVRGEMLGSDEFLTGDVYREGLANVLAEPEFAESDAARNALKVLEEKPLLEDLLNRTVMPSDIGGVQVLIGGEGTWDELRDFSMVLARYGVSEVATGTLGVLGPIRMPYSRTISTVRFVSQVLSDLVSETLTE